MNVKELRIGNYVCNPEGHIFQLPQIAFSMLSERESDEWDFVPVELTEEWLLKFGFIHTYYGGTYQYESFTMSIDSEYGMGEISADKSIEHGLTCYLLDCDNGWVGKKIEYVHSLQNLYFALTGSELEIKL